MGHVRWRDSREYLDRAEEEGTPPPHPPLPPFHSEGGIGERGISYRLRFL